MNHNKIKEEIYELKYLLFRHKQMCRRITGLANSKHYIPMRKKVVDELNDKICEYYSQKMALSIKIIMSIKQNINQCKLKIESCDDIVDHWECVKTKKRYYNDISRLSQVLLHEEDNFILFSDKFKSIF